MKGYCEFWAEYAKKVSLERNRSEMLQDLVRGIGSISTSLTWLEEEADRSCIPDSPHPSGLEAACPPVESINRPPKSASKLSPRVLDRVSTSLEVSEVNVALFKLLELEKKYLPTTTTTTTTTTTAGSTTITTTTISTAASTPSTIPQLPFLLRIKLRAAGKRKLQAMLKNLRKHNDDLERRLQLKLALYRAIQVTATVTRVPETVSTSIYSFVTAQTQGSGMQGDESVCSIQSPVSPSIPTRGARQEPTAVDYSPFSSPSFLLLPPPPSVSAVLVTNPNNDDDVDVDVDVDDESSDGFDLQSVGLSRSQDRDDNYSIHTNDRICKHCRRVSRGGYSSDEGI